MLRKAFVPIVAALLLLAPSLASAAGLDTMFATFGGSIPPLMKLAGKVAVVMGVVFVILGIHKLIQVEQGKAEFKTVLWLFVAGVGLFALYPAIDTINSSLGGGGLAIQGGFNVLGQNITPSGPAAAMAGAVQGILAFVKLLGAIAFIRGLTLLKAYGENKEGSMARAMTHLFGGVLASNIVWTVGMLASTVGACDAVSMFGIPC